MFSNKASLISSSSDIDLILSTLFRVLPQSMLPHDPLILDPLPPSMVTQSTQSLHTSHTLSLPGPEPARKPRAQKSAITDRLASRHTISSKSLSFDLWFKEHLISLLLTRQSTPPKALANANVFHPTAKQVKNSSNRRSPNRRVNNVDDESWTVREGECNLNLLLRFMLMMMTQVRTTIRLDKVSASWKTYLLTARWCTRCKQGQRTWW